MTRKKGFLNKFKSLFKRKKDQSNQDVDFEEDFDDSNEVDLDSLPENLRAQILADQNQIEFEEDEDEEEDEIPEFSAMSVNKEKIDQEFDLDNTSPSTVIKQMEPTRETTLPDEIDEEELQARFEAIRDGASSEDDQFAEHSGINDFKEFEINKSNKKSSQIFLNILSRIKGYAPALKREKPRKNAPVVKEKSKLGSLQLSEILFAPQERPRLHGIFVSILILCATYGLGKMMALYLDTSSAPKSLASSSTASNIISTLQEAPGCST
jgi:hypothetical protein